MADEKSTVKENVKIVLGIQDNMQDPVLDIFIRNVEAHLLSRLKRVNKTITTIPTDLNYVVEEIVIRRYNRIGSEGMKSESVEGHKVDFYDLKDEFIPYQEIIDDYAEPSDDRSGGRGRVLFI